MIRQLWHDESGQDLAEYGLLVALIALSAVAALQSVGTALLKLFQAGADALTNAT